MTLKAYIPILGVLLSFLSAQAVELSRSSTAPTTTALPPLPPCRTVTFPTYLPADHRGLDPSISCVLHVGANAPDYVVTFTTTEHVVGEHEHAYRVEVRATNGGAAEALSAALRTPVGAYSGFKSFQVEDFNFDGFSDVALLRDFPADKDGLANEGPTHYDIYLFKPATHTFKSGA